MYKTIVISFHYRKILHDVPLIFGLLQRTIPARLLLVSTMEKFMMGHEDTTHIMDMNMLYTQHSKWDMNILYPHYSAKETYSIYMLMHMLKHMLNVRCRMECRCRRR